jgi:hypothetical protein
MNMLRPLKKVASSAKALDTKQADNKQASSSFLKKRTKKLFLVGAQTLACDTLQTGNGFLVLFFKKELLPCLPSRIPQFADRP